MSRQKTHHTKQFKLDAINYRKEHPDLTQVECAKNPGIGVSTLARWEAQFRDNDGDIPVIGSGSYASDEAKEIAHLKRELRDTQDALDVLKKAIGILNEQFNPGRPNAVRCTDITYIWTQDGFVYLNCVIDLYARKIIAWTLADTMEVKNAFIIVTLFATNHSASPNRISIRNIDSNLISSLTSMLSEQKPITKNSTTRDEPTATKTGSIPSMTAQGPPPLKLTGGCPSIVKTRDI